LPPRSPPPRSPRRFTPRSITEFRIGLLGGENAQDRLASNECFRAYTEELLGVPTRLFTAADYNGVIQGLIGGTLDMAWLGASAYAKPST
jgi:phosphonate transport system substrate-binding protein